MARLSSRYNGSAACPCHDPWSQAAITLSSSTITRAFSLKPISVNTSLRILTRAQVQASRDSSLSLRSKRLRAFVALMPCDRQSATSEPKRPLPQGRRKERPAMCVLRSDNRQLTRVTQFPTRATTMRTKTCLWYCRHSLLAEARRSESEESGHPVGICVRGGKDGSGRAFATRHLNAENGRAAVGRQWKTVTKGGRLRNKCAA